jgi:hypothetical protein
LALRAAPISATVAGFALESLGEKRREALFVPLDVGRKLSEAVQD